MSLTEVTCVIFLTHQTSGTCAGQCEWDYIQMNKTEFLMCDTIRRQKFKCAV